MLDYVKLVNHVLAGHRVESRLGPSREVLGHTVVCTPYELVWRPKINKALGWMELIQLIAGVFEPKEIMRVAPSAKREYFTSMSAYGPRIHAAWGDQADWNEQSHEPDDEYIQRVLRHLRDTPNTRKAVLFIGKSYDNLDNDLSCTLTYQFLARDGVLHAIVTMRSWDVVRGLPYDIIMFGGLLQAVAHVLNLKPGFLNITAGSLHIYEQDEELIPLSQRVATYHLRLSKDSLWSGIRMMCKNQVHQKWEETETKAPHFIHVSPWSEI